MTIMVCVIQILILAGICFFQTYPFSLSDLHTGVFEILYYARSNKDNNKTNRSTTQKKTHTTAVGRGAGAYSTGIVSSLFKRFKIQEIQDSVCSSVCSLQFSNVIVL